MSKYYPFKFLNAYEKEDIAIFFGREKEVEAFYRMIFQTNLLLIYGASGTGKTSMIRCGLTNKFKKSQWNDLYIRRGDNITDSLIQIIEEATNKSGIEKEVEEDMDWFEDFVDASPSEVISSEIETPVSIEIQIEEALRTLYFTNFIPIYLIFDQFEELYTLGNKEEQKVFTRVIAHLIKVDLPVKIILSMREEYFANLYELEQTIPQLREKRLRLEPMASSVVEQVIQKATVDNSNSSILIEKDNSQLIAKAITDNIREGDIHIKLPYLQVYIDRLHEEVRQNAADRNEVVTFTLELVEQVGKIEAVLKNFIEKQINNVYQVLHPIYGVSREHIWEVLSPFATLEGTKIPIKETSFEALAKEISYDFETEAAALSFIKKCTHEFERHRVLRYRRDDKTYEVLHDTLSIEIAEKRSEEQKALLRIKRLIENQNVLKNDDKELLTEQQLNYITPVLGQLSLSKEEEALIQNSYAALAEKKAIEKAKQEEELQKAKEQTTKERKLKDRANRNFRIAILLALLGLVLSIFAFYQQGIAQNATKEAEKQTKTAKKAKEIAEKEKETAEKAKKRAESSDSLAKIDRDKAIYSDSLARIDKDKAIQSDSIAQIEKAKTEKVLDKLALAEAKKASVSLQALNFEKCLEHLKNATLSKEKAVQQTSKEVLADLVIISMDYYGSEDWKEKLSPLVLAFKKTRSGIQIDFNKSNSRAVFDKDLKKALTLVQQGNKRTAKKGLIEAMQRKLGEDKINLILLKYNIFLN